MQSHPLETVNIKNTSQVQETRQKVSIFYEAEKSIKDAEYGNR